MVDDMGYSDIGCYGGEIDTPNLDTLAQSGLRFRQFYIQDYYDSNKLQLDGESYTGEPAYITDLITDHGLEFLEEAQSKEKPFFLYLPYNAPHYPLQAPREQIDK